MPASKSNPMFTRSEKRRARKKVVHKIKGAARKGFAKLFGIPLSPGLGGKASSRRTAHRSSGAHPASSTVRGDVISALMNLGYKKHQAETLAPAAQAGENFDSLFRRATRRNPAELIIFGNPAKVYGRANVVKAARAGNPVPAALLMGFESALGSIGASALTSKRGKKNPRFFGRQMSVDQARQYALDNDLPFAPWMLTPEERNKQNEAWKKMRAESRQRERDRKKKLKESRKGKVLEMPRRNRSKRNPDAIGKAEELFETFHHRGSSGMFETQRSAKSRKDFTSLGPLVAIGINAEQYDERRRAMGKKDFEEYKVEHWDKLPHLAFLTGPQVSQVKRILEEPEKLYAKDCPQLASSPNGKQLYAITPDGVEIDLRQFDTDVSKDFIDLGEATFVVYIAKKPDTPLEWVHELGEDGGVRPRLVLNRLGKKELFFVGGSYTVEGPGIMH